MARYLLDTNAWLWMLDDSRRLSREARRLLADDGNELVLSAVSSWEIAIKWSSGKLDLPEPPPIYVADRLERTATTELVVTHLHSAASAMLPWHHRDPFDRLLIAQAMVEHLPIITGDRVFARYGITVIDATR